MIINHNAFVWKLMGETGFIHTPQPHQEDADQVSMRIPAPRAIKITPRVLPREGCDTGNSNPILRVHKNIKWNGTLGKLEKLLREG